MPACLKKKKKKSEHRDPKYVVPIRGFDIIIIMIILRGGARTYGQARDNTTEHSPRDGRSRRRRVSWEKTAEEGSSLREKFGLAGAWMGPERDA